MLNEVIKYMMKSWVSNMTISELEKKKQQPESKSIPRVSYKSIYRYVTWCEKLDYFIDIVISVIVVIRIILLLKNVQLLYVDCTPKLSKKKKSFWYTYGVRVVFDGTLSLDSS